MSERRTPDQEATVKEPPEQQPADHGVPPTESLLAPEPGGAMLAAGFEPTQLQAALTHYTLGGLLGRGGMGEVVAAHDLRIGRDVAIKRLRDEVPSDSSVERFLREAKVQARLEHPSIVPVHELGRDAIGRPYFTMKRLAGQTLAKRLAERPPLQALLRVFAEICLAIDFAHSRGVIHRDLKPANIMLGDYGEVYVLDWGLARIVATVDLPSSPDAIGDLSAHETRAGELMGTPAYMAPEQMKSPHVDKPADVFALGAILFEILTREALYPRSLAFEALHAIKVASADATRSPAQRSPGEVPPELDALCIAALAPDPAARPTARQLATRIQAYLDGDRDLARRRELAADQLATARTELAAGRRAEAMRAAARALAFEPQSQPGAEAAELLTHLMLAPPKEPTPELVSAWRDAEADAIRRHGFGSAVGFALILTTIPVAIWSGIRSWPLLVAIAGLAVLLATATFAICRHPYRSTRDLFVLFGGMVAMIALVERVAGPLILVPALGCLIVWAALMYPPLSRYPWIVFSLVLLAWLVPTVLEHVDVLPSTWSIEDGAITSTSRLLDLDGMPSIIAVFGTNVLALGIAAFHASTLTRATIDAERRLVAQAWHLRQLLPH